MRGFTLLELLISITMIGLIALVITGAMRLGSRSVDRGEKRIESLERLKNSVDIVESVMMSEIPLSYEEDGNRRYYFQGERDYVQFTTTYSILGSQRGIVLISLKVNTDNYGKRYLAAKELPLIGGNEAEAVLFEGFDEIFFEYFYKDPTEEEGQWVGKWIEETIMPNKIRIGLVKDNKDLSLIVALPVVEKQLQTSQPVLKGLR